MRRTKKEYEAYLNGLYSGDEAFDKGVYMAEGDTALTLRQCLNCLNLLADGKYGTALRRYDPVAFEVGYREWINY